MMSKNNDEFNGNYELNCSMQEIIHEINKICQLNKNEI